MSVARRPDEEALWAAVLAGETPAAARGPLGIRYGRCIYLCEKWKARGIYDYATEPDVGRIERWTWVAVLCSTQEWLSETQESHDARIEHAIGEAAAEADRLHVTGITATLHLEAMGWYDPAIDDGMPSVTAIRFEGTPTLDTHYPSAVCPPAVGDRWQNGLRPVSDRSATPGGLDETHTVAAPYPVDRQDRHRFG